MISIELISALVGLVLTLMVFSYLLGDTFLFRIAINVFIGVASGYAVAVVIHHVLIPRLFDPIPVLSNDPVQLIVVVVVPLVLSFSLLAKLLPRISWVGSFAMALLVGVGAATVVGGAVAGTLIPQIQASGEAPSLIEGFVTLLGTVLTLAYFQFSARRGTDGSVKRNVIFEILAWAGRVFIAVTFGVLFAGVYMAALTAMIERLSSIVNLVKSLLGL